MATRTKTKDVQFIAGEFALVPRVDYERLLKIAAAAEEDIADRAVIRDTRRALKEGREVLIPNAFAARIMEGENPVRVAREWRGLSQGDLAAMVAISQGYLSDIEHEKRTGTSALHKKLATALGVPLDLLID